MTIVFTGNGDGASLLARDHTGLPEPAEWKVKRPGVFGEISVGIKLPARFKHGNRESGLTQLFGGHPAGGPGPDHNDVVDFACHIRSPFWGVCPLRSGLTTAST